MIEEALLQHMQNQAALSSYLTTYDGTPAVFYQEAPADVDPLWANGTQYGRIVFDVDMQGDPERTMGGLLTVDIMCQKGKQFPEDIEPVVRELIHGYFFTTGTFAAAAQWKNSALFTEATDEVIGCTMTFDLLAFPVLTSFPVDVIDRLNEWSAAIEGLHVINHDELPQSAWKPESDSAVYWRVVTQDSCKWIPDTYQTIWRTAVVRCHIFSRDIASATAVARDLVYRLYAAKRLMREGESPIMVNAKGNPVDVGADPLRTGQLTIDCTFGVIVAFASDQKMEKIEYSDKGEEERRNVNVEEGIR